MMLLFAMVLGILGILVLFVVPWIGAAVLAAGAVVALLAILYGGAKSEKLVEHEEPERPHMRGPSS
jgi:hypothetical protein